jgi:hypothetical protein
LQNTVSGFTGLILVHNTINNSRDIPLLIVIIIITIIIVIIIAIINILYHTIIIIAFYYYYIIIIVIINYKESIICEKNGRLEIFFIQICYFIQK